MSYRALETMVQTEGSELLRRLIQGHLDQRSAEEPIRERMVGEVLVKEVVGGSFDEAVDHLGRAQAGG